jgi:methylenetetrahydrofolate reductase (NADPH)
MAYRQEETVAEIIDRSGVLAGRVPWYPERDARTDSPRKVS